LCIVLEFESSAYLFKLCPIVVVAFDEFRAINVLHQLAFDWAKSAWLVKRFTNSEKNFQNMIFVAMGINDFDRCISQDFFELITISNTAH
jgi:hypothetical protein